MASFLQLLSNDKSLENNLELVQQIALRNYLVNGEESKPFYNLVTSARIGNELYQRVSGSRKIEEYRKQCIASIVAFIQKNPNASSNTLKKEVEKQVALFAVRISTI